ncbi:MAG: hypothetical protein IRZ05_21620, partial [Micromonosporaceae bacterium]|nr:hypothetical protein [Micromonosporaceae bacterium]
MAWAKAGPALRVVAARVWGPVRLACARAGAMARAVVARMAAVPARLSALVRSVPTPQRALLGGIAVAGLATAAFLLVAQPAGMLPAGGSGDGTRALEGPRSTGGAASHSRGAIGHAAETTKPGPPSAPHSGPAASVPADGPATAGPEGIALGMPEITGKVTPGADPGQGDTAQTDTVQKDTARKDTARDTTRSLPGFGQVEKDRPEPRRGNGRPAVSGAAGRGGAAHTGRESDRLTGAGRGRVDGRPASEPVMVAALAGEQGSRRADTSGGTTPERQRVRGQLSRHLSQERHEHARARSSGHSGVRQTSAAAGARREPQAGRPATGHAPHAGPGDARHRPEDHGRAHARSAGRGGARQATVRGTDAEGALAVAVDPLGALLRGQSGLVAVRLRNTGDAATEDITATVTLPPGVRYLKHDGGRGRAARPDAVGRDDGVREKDTTGGGAGQGRADDGPAGSGRTKRAPTTGDGWSCAASGRLVRCARGPLAAGEVTAIFLRVAVAADAPTGRAFTVRVRSGRLETTAKSTVGVRGAGAAARF